MHSNQLQKRVIDYISKLLERSDSVALPPVRCIAAHCAVSAGTVCKVIKELKEQKRLFTKWGSQLRVKPPVTSTMLKDQALRWESARDSLKEDIRSGVYAHGVLLPSKKQLCSRMQVSYQTLNKALVSLSNTGTISREGSRYRVSTVSKNPRWRPKVVVICSGHRAGVPKIESERERDFYHFLLIEAEAKGLELEYVVYDDWKERASFLSDKGETGILSKDDDVLGYIVSSWHVRDLQNCLHTLSILKKRICIWVENPGDVSHIKGDNLTFFNIGYSPLPGFQMGNYLLSLGHRDIAYLSPFHGSRWSQERLYGLIDSIKSAGPEYHVHPFTDSQAESEWTFTDLKKDAILGVVDTTSLYKQLPGEMKRRIERFKTEGINLFRDACILDRIRNSLDYIISRGDITAIVAANDLTALLVLEYLRQRELKIPENISVASFDNTFEGLIQGLTSFNFNTRAMVEAMLSIATGSDSDENREVRYFGGTVMERASTGPAPK